MGGWTLNLLLKMDGLPGTHGTPANVDTVLQLGIHLDLNHYILCKFDGFLSLLLKIDGLPRTHGTHANRDSVLHCYS